MVADTGLELEVEGDDDDDDDCAGLWVVVVVAAADDVLDPPAPGGEVELDVVVDIEEIPVTGEEVVMDVDDDVPGVELLLETWDVVLEGEAELEELREEDTVPAEVPEAELTIL